MNGGLLNQTVIQEKLKFRLSNSKQNLLFSRQQFQKPLKAIIYLYESKELIGHKDLSAAQNYSHLQKQNLMEERNYYN